MTEDRTIDECLDDPEWRIRNLYLIFDEDKNLVPLKMREEQERFLCERHFRNFVPKSRKLGMSTIIVLKYLDACIHAPPEKPVHAAHVDFRETDAKEKLKIARDAWINGPNHPDPVIANIWAALHIHNPLTTDSATELAWANGSKQQAGTSFMGGTPGLLHISEYGPLAAQAPDRARKVKQGTFNAVPKGGTIDVETTMEGGKFGECYELFKLASDNASLTDLNPLEWKLHFFPWYGHPSYILQNRRPMKEETIKYFTEIERTYGVKIPLDRQAWYEAKNREQRENMWTQYPSVADECVKISVHGAIYPYITTLRVKGRVADFEIERNVPLITGWDLGISDYTSGWCVQFAGRDILWHQWFEMEGEGAGAVAEVIRSWESQFNQKIAVNLFPHDAELRDKGTAKTYVDILKESGVPSTTIKVVPRTPDLWIGIDAVRKMLPKSWFHRRTDQERRNDAGTPQPSGLMCLESYRKAPPTGTGVLRNEPVHDRTSHTADAARTIGEAWERGMLSNLGVEDFKAQTKVVSGYRGHQDNRPQLKILR